MNPGLRIGRLIVCAAAAALTLLAMGCSDGKIENPFQSEPVVADVDVAGEMTAVESSGNAHSQTGVKHLRAESWSAAAEELQLALNDNAKDWKSAYALGVAYEKMGRHADALRAYEQANLHVKGAGDSSITAAILRMKEEVR